MCASNAWCVEEPSRRVTRRWRSSGSPSTRFPPRCSRIIASASATLGLDASRPSCGEEDLQVMRRIHHVGVVVNKLTEAYRFYREVLGLPLLKEKTIAEQGVRAGLLAAGDTEIELLEPLDTSSGIGRFLAQRGEGLHHLCFETPDVGAAP